MSVTSGLIKVTKRGAKPPAKAAPFYSAVDNAVDNLPNKATPEQMIKELLKQKEVKAQELIDRGIDKKLGVPIVQKERTVKLKKPDAKGNTEKVEKYFEVTPGEKGAKAITKDEVIDAVEQNPPKQVTEDIMGDPTQKMINQKIEDMIEKEVIQELGPRPKYGHERMDWLDDYDRLIEQKSYRSNDYYDEAKEAIKKEGTWGSSKYDRPDWKLAGGENYREIVLKLPATKSANEQRIMELEAYERRGATNKDLLDELAQLRANRDAAPDEFQSRHWDQPNVLAHMRVQDRVGPNGEKVLHVEEIQSDWHQEGRKKGYQKNAEKQYVEYLNDLEKRVAEDIKKDMISEGVAEDRAMELGQNMAKRMADDPRKLAEFLGESEKQMSLHQARLADRNAVPDAPFKKNWHELAMKRLINYASENGYDKIAITPGAEQAKRYDLSKHLNEINYGKNPDNTYSLTAVDKSGHPVFNESKMTEQELVSTVGKDVAQKIINGEGVQFPAGSISEGMRSLSGLDLQVGGEGMKGFYDQILPAYLSKYGEKYGAKVSPIEVTRPPRDSTLAFGYPGGDDYVAGKITWNEFLQQSPHAAKEFSTQLHGFDITPQMREEVLTKGQPLYQQIGIPAATGAAGAEMLGAEMPEEPGFAEGGAVNENTVPDMSDGGQILQGPPFKRGGKVSITNNPDAMFLELNDKKFRRK